MHAVIALSDGLVADLAIFNSKDEAIAMRDRLAHTVGVVWDRLDVRPVSMPADFATYAADEYAAATKE